MSEIAVAVIAVIVAVLGIFVALYQREVRSVIAKFRRLVSTLCRTAGARIASFYHKWVHRRLLIDGYVSNHVKDYERDLVDSLLQQYRDAFNQANFSHLTLECKNNVFAQQLLDAVRHQGAGRMSELAYWIAQICPDDNPLDGDFKPDLWAMMWSLEDGALARVPESSRTREFMRLSHSMPKAESLKDGFRKMAEDFISDTCRTGQRCRLSGIYHCRSHRDFAVEVVENDCFPDCSATANPHSTVWQWVRERVESVKDVGFARFLADLESGERTAIPEFTEHIYRVSESGERMIHTRDLLLGIMVAYSRGAAGFPSSQRDLTDKVKAELGCNACSAFIKSLVDDVSESVVRLWRGGKIS